MTGSSDVEKNNDQIDALTCVQPILWDEDASCKTHIAFFFELITPALSHSNRYINRNQNYI